MTKSLILMLAWFELAAACRKRVDPVRQEPPVKPDEDDDEESREERDRDRDNYWRAQISIIGQGRVSTVVHAFDCTSDGTRQWGECGPKLVMFKELAPPLMRAISAKGWHHDHWESVIRAADGSLSPRKGPMPDGLLYLNGFGYADTGALETVKAVFVPDGQGSASP